MNNYRIFRASTVKPGPELDQMRMPLFQQSQWINVTQTYSKQSRLGRPEPLNLCLALTKNMAILFR